MQSFSIRGIFMFLFLGLFLSLSVSGKEGHKPKKKRTGSIYFSWGYNQEWYTNSTIEVQQNAIGNYYKLTKVEGHDHKGWDEDGGIFHKALTIPQYNYRLGYYFNERQDIGIEINFDHTKYIVTDGQTVHLKGTYHGRPTDTNMVFSEATGSYYYLNNGANFLLINLVKRRGLYQSHSNNLRVDFNGKIGIGPVIPHVENSFFGLANEPHFQIGGWNAGVETALRATFMKYAFLEFSQKFDYARYSGLRIYNGTARQAFATYELVMSIGFIIPTTSHNPMFAKPIKLIEEEQE